MDPKATLSTVSICHILRQALLHVTLTGIYQHIWATMACLWKSYLSNLDKTKISVSLRVRGPIRIWILTVSPSSSRLGPPPSTTPHPTLQHTPLSRALCWEFGILEKVHSKRFSDHWSVFKGNNGTLIPSFPLQAPHSHSLSFPLCSWPRQQTSLVKHSFSAAKWSVLS